MMEQSGERCSITFNGERPKTTRTGRQNWPDKDKKDENSTNNFRVINWLFGKESNNKDGSVKHNVRKDESSTNVFHVLDWLFGKKSNNAEESAKHNDKKDESSTIVFHVLDWLFGKKRNNADESAEHNDTKDESSTKDFHSTDWLFGKKWNNADESAKHNDKKDESSTKDFYATDWLFGNGSNNTHESAKHNDKKDESSTKDFYATDWPFGKERNNTDGSAEHNDTKDESSTMDFHTLDLSFGKKMNNTDEIAEHNGRKDESSTMDFHELDWPLDTERDKTDENAENNDKKDKNSTNVFHKFDRVFVRECIKTNESYENNYKMTEQQGVRPNVESLVVVTMNTNGPNKTSVMNPQDKRRQVIARLIEQYKPAIIFCQEFKSKGIKGKVWEKYRAAITKYNFYGNEEGSILVDKMYVSPDQRIDRKLRQVLESLQDNSNNELKQRFPLDFDPLSRIGMCRAIKQFKDGKTCEFLCASWHGWWNKKNREGRIELFIYLMEFLRQVVNKFNLPLIIGGDFNIDIHDVKELVKDPFSLGMYASSKRRKDKEKDFFIVSKDLRLVGIESIDYEEDLHAMLNEFSPNDIFDHDPIKATLKFA